MLGDCFRFILHRPARYIDDMGGDPGNGIVIAKGDGKGSGKGDVQGKCQGPQVLFIRANAMCCV